MKSKDAFRTISEVEAILEVPQHTLRYWEAKIAQVRPTKRGGNRRLYRPSDINLLSGLKQLFYADGLTLKGVKKIISDKGVEHVVNLNPVDLDQCMSKADVPGRSSPKPVQNMELAGVNDTSTILAEDHDEQCTRSGKVVDPDALSRPNPSSSTASEASAGTTEAKEENSDEHELQSDVGQVSCSETPVDSDLGGIPPEACREGRPKSQEYLETEPESNSGFQPETRIQLLRIYGRLERICTRIESELDQAGSEHC